MPYASVLYKINILEVSRDENFMSGMWENYKYNATNVLSLHDGYFPLAAEHRMKASTLKIY